MSPTVEPNEPNTYKDSVEASPTRRAVIGAAGAGIVSAALPSAVSAASAGGAEGLSSGTGIIASAVQGPSNTTVTPTAVSVSGVNYNVYQFTQDGSFTVSGGSLNADVLLIGGGGGGGGGYFGGGGGAGEILPLTSKSFVAGNYVVTIGQGGASTTDGNPSKITYGAGAVSPGSTWESEARKGLKGGNGTETSQATGGKSGDQFNGGLEAGGGGGGGGGSTAAGANATSNYGAAGGAGESVTGYWTSTLTVGGGGGGAGYLGGGSATSGGGAGGRFGSGVGAGTEGFAGTGGGGGGAYDGTGGTGGSGAIYVRILA